MTIDLTHPENVSEKPASANMTDTTSATRTGTHNAAMVERLKDLKTRAETYRDVEALNAAIRSLAASPPVPDPRNAEIEDECKFLNWLLDTIGEININNYHHDDVCRMNETNVEAILAIHARIKSLATAGGPEDAEIDSVAVAQEIADGCYGDNPLTRYAAQEYARRRPRP